jgi:hypothetical protein
VQVPVNITGVQGTLKDMRKFDPDLAKQMNTQIRGAMLPIRDKARAFAPGNSEMLSGWTTANTSTAARGHRFFPKYDQSETRDGIVYRQGANNKGEIAGAKFRRRWQVAYFVANNSPGGAIFETSGRVNPNGRPASRIVSSRHKLESQRKYRVASGTTKDMNSLNPNAGRQFLAPLGPLYGSRGTIDPRFGNTDQRGRLIYRAWAEDQGRAAHAVNLAINIAVAQFNAKHTANAYGMAA